MINKRSVPTLITEQKNEDIDQPLVSIFNWSFNDEKFIRESIESILFQKTTFSVEIIIHDDASDDGTKEIILEYQLKYPNLFRNILHVDNQYSQGKDIMFPLYTKTRGKYIALSHGDDYWLDPLKLQKQVDFMEANTDFCMCFTRYQRYFQDTNVFQISGHNKSKVYKLKDFMYANHAATATVLYKKNQYDYKYLNKGPFGDWILYNLILKHGDAYYMDDVTTVYRRHYYNSEYYNPTPYKKKLYKLNFLFLKIHGLKYLFIFLKKIIQMSIFNKLH